MHSPHIQKRINKNFRLLDYRFIYTTITCLADLMSNLDDDKVTTCRGSMSP